MDFGGEFSILRWNSILHSIGILRSSSVSFEHVKIFDFSSFFLLSVRMLGVSSASFPHSGGLSNFDDLGRHRGWQAPVVMSSSTESSGFGLTPMVLASSSKFDHLDFWCLEVPRSATMVAGTSDHGGVDDGDGGDNLVANRDSGRNEVENVERGDLGNAA